ncbi:Peptidyl-tRNA hydrolase [Anaerolineae bacterium]|nr:Peptidyl-tRNA hydrolase [Anaerolineae bacterium]
MTDRYLIVGLGNPGRDFENTRHNIGFRAVESIAAAHGLGFSKRQSKALVADGIIAEKKVLIAKPQTFMNLSGESVRGFVDFYKIPLDHIFVISDDLDIPLGTLRIRAKGGSGGQGGLKSIIAHLGSSDFARMRVGIGRPPGRMLARDYVLQNFAPAEDILVIETLHRADKAIETWLRLGIELMMTRHNGTADESARNANADAPKPDAPTKGTTPDA